jgi:hypothetical protein
MNTQEMLQESADRAAAEKAEPNPGALLVEMIQANPDILMDALSMAADTAESIQDIPLQIELLSRVTLAKSFISLQNGKANFDQATFENVWRFLTLQTDAPPEKPSK